VFDRSDVWETPMLTAELCEEITRRFGNIPFTRRGDGMTFDMEFTADGLSTCPMLGENGCMLGDDKPFCCRIWPFRLMNTDGGVSLTLSPLCEKVGSAGDENVRKFVDSGFSDTVFAYAKEHPEIIREYDPAYKTIITK